MKKEPALVLMAAGLGTRYGGLKQMVPITNEGEIILDFALYDAYKAGFKKVIFVIKKEIEEDFKKLIEGKADQYLETQYAFQELESLPPGYQLPEGRLGPWGTSHAILCAKDLIEGPFCAINSDDYYGPDAFVKAYNFFMAEEEREMGRYAMVGYKVQKTLSDQGTVTRGVCKVEDNFLAHIAERRNIKKDGERIIYSDDDQRTWKEIPIDTTVSMNFWLFDSGFMENLEEQFKIFLDKVLPGDPLKAEWLLPDTIEELLTEQKATVEVMESENQWYGVTYKEDRDFVSRSLELLKDKGIYPKKLWG